MKTVRLELTNFTRLVLLSLLFTTFSSNVFGSTLNIENGNIYYKQETGKKMQLTRSGKDRAAVLSPSGQYVAFIRKSSKPADYPAENPNGYSQDELLADQIWVVDLSMRKERLLVEDQAADEPAKAISHIEDNSLKFSLDGKKLYFIISAWVTSGAVHAVSLDGSGERFVTAGNSVDVVPSGGEYRGHLIVRQHRYFIGGGSYDWLWLFDPDGKEIAPVGEEIKQSQAGYFGLPVEKAVSEIDNGHESFMKGIQAYQQMDYDVAISFFREALEILDIDPVKAGERNKKLQADIAKNPKTKDGKDRSVAFFKDWLDSYYYLGLAYAKKGDEKAAFEQVATLKIIGRSDYADTLESEIKQISLGRKVQF